MKILYSHYLENHDHPAARMVDSIAHELREFGHEVVVQSSRFGGNSDTQPEHRSQNRSGLTTWFRRRLWFARIILRDHRRRPFDLETIRRYRPDVILARHDAYRSSMAWAAKKTGVPLVTYADAPVAHEVRRYREDSRWHPPGLVEAIERATLASSRRIVTISHPSAEILNQYRLHVPIDVAPNGIDPGRFPTLDLAERLRLRESLAIREPIVIGFQGTFKAFHGLDRLRELIESTADRTDVRWLLIGDGPGLSKLQESVVNCGNVTFLGRRRPEEMGRLLSIMDIAVAPYEINTGPFYFSPLKILEYAAAGCAILAADQGDIANLLDNGRVGVLLREPGLEAWTKSLASMLGDRPRIMSLGDAARQWTLEHRTWQETARIVESSLVEALESDLKGHGSVQNSNARSMTYSVGRRD